MTADAVAAASATLRLLMQTRELELFLSRFTLIQKNKLQRTAFEIDDTKHLVIKCTGQTGEANSTTKDGKIWDDSWAKRRIEFFPTNQTLFVAVDEVAQDNIMDEFRSARRVNDIQVLVTALGVCFNLLMCRFAVFLRDN